MVIRVVLAAVAAVLVVSCGGDDSDDGSGAPSQAVPTVGVTDGGPASSSDATGTTGSTGTSDVPAGGGGGGAGQATLTVGDESWTFDGIYCAFGPEETRNDRVSFSSGAFGEIEGTRVQLDASIQDPQEQGRYEGDGVIHSVTLNDIQDFQNPKIGWDAVSGFVGGSQIVFQIDGKNVRVEAAFDDETTDEIESIAGTLEMTCP